MKRLAWLFLIVFGTALAQVQPVELPVAPEKTCDCCDQPGACGMPDCSLPPAAIPAAFTAEPSIITVAQPAAANEIAPAKAIPSQFWAAIPLPTKRVAFPVSPGSAPPASVPLFKAHCTFLI
ncbi:MAG TPA: hypothetical protein VFJ90_08365 [Candidatus Didemnitutus sp.]|nr:hypothetical protein [Candidatus Didemnitutus sp.]